MRAKQRSKARKLVVETTDARQGLYHAVVALHKRSLKESSWWKAELAQVSKFVDELAACRCQMADLELAQSAMLSLDERRQRLRDAIRRTWR